MIQRTFGGEEGIIHNLPAENAHPGLPNDIPTGHIIGKLGRLTAGIGFGQLFTGIEEVIYRPGWVIPLGSWQHRARFFKHILVIEERKRSHIVRQAIDAAFVAITLNRQFGKFTQIITIFVNKWLEIQQQVFGEEFGEIRDADNKHIRRLTGRKLGKQLVRIPTAPTTWHRGEIHFAARIGFTKWR